MKWLTRGVSWRPVVASKVADDGVSEVITQSYTHIAILQLCKLLDES